MSEDRLSPFLLLSLEVLLLLSLPLQSGLSPPFSQEPGCFLWVISTCGRLAWSMRKLWSCRRSWNFKRAWKERNPSSKCTKRFETCTNGASPPLHPAYRFWLTVGHVWARLPPQVFLPCFLLLTSGCLDRFWGPGREGRRINGSILLGDRRELELQRRSRTAADGFWRWTLKFGREREEAPLSADACHDCTVDGFVDTRHLPIRGRGGFSASRNRLDLPAGRRWLSSWANI